MKKISTGRDSSIYRMMRNNREYRKLYYEMDLKFKPAEAEFNRELFSYYAFPGAYPLYYITADDSVLCAKCANCQTVHCYRDSSFYIVAVDINYENDDLFCEHCYTRIESAYGENEG